MNYLNSSLDSLQDLSVLIKASKIVDRKLFENEDVKSYIEIYF